MSGLFGDLLGSPVDRARVVLTAELELRRQRQPASGWGKVYPTGADLLIKHGKLWAGREVPEEFLHLVGEVGNCYWNAASAAEADSRLTYCEGIVAPGDGRFLSHAWCIDADGNVYDFTWHGGVGRISRHTGLPTLPYDRWTYMGVTFRPELMRAHSDAYGMPMLGRDMVAESTLGTRQTEDGQWLTPTGINVTPPEKLPLLDVPYDPNRTELP